MLSHKKKLLQSLIHTILASIFFLSQFAYADIVFTQNDVNEATKQALALYNTNEDDSALEILEKIPKEYRNEETWLILSNIYEDKNDLDKAIATLNQIVRINPKFYKTYYNLGCLFLKKKEYALAISNFKLCLKENSEFAYAHYNLGCSYLALKNYKKAKKHFIMALDFAPEDKNILYNLAYTYKMLGDNKSAKRILEKY